MTTTKIGYFAAISYQYPFTLNCMMYFTRKWYLTAELISNPQSALLTINENESTRQGHHKELAVNSTRKRKSVENFVRRANILYNILSRHAQYTNVKLNESSLMNIYWQYFIECYNEKTSCTWRILCLWGPCNS